MDTYYNLQDTFVETGDVRLYGTTFPIYGTVRRTAVTPFAPKFTIGDHTRDDEIVSSSLILSNFSGGLGILYAQLPKDADRFWYSTLESRYKYLTLGPEIIKAGTLNGPVDLMIEYQEQLFVVVGDTIYTWSETLGDFEVSSIIEGTPTAAEVYNGVLFILTDIFLYEYDVDTLTWSNNTVDPPESGYALIEWDGKLFRLGMDNHLYWSLGDGVWEDGGTLHLPPGYCRQLMVYFDLTGEPVIHAITRVGVYGYDFDSKKFFATPLTFPVTQNAGKGAVVFRGELLVPAGKIIYKYNGSTIQVISPSKDDGLPETLQGDIVQLIEGHAFVYAVISTAVGGDPTPEVEFFDASNPIDPFIISPAIANGAVLASPGASWHGFVDQPAGSSMGAGLVASIEGTFRFWISNGEGVFYVNLDTGLHNPLQNPATTFKEHGYLETGWTDLGWSEMKKLALDCSVVASNCSSTETISIYAAWDDDSSWELIGTIDQSGYTEIQIGGLEGRVFRTVRFRLEMSRGEDQRKTPILRQIVFSFMRRPPMLWGWEVDLMLTTELKAGKTGEELLNYLHKIAEGKIAGEFIYQDPATDLKHVHRVVIANIQGAQPSGPTAQGRYTVSLIQLDTPDEEGFGERVS